MPSITENIKIIRENIARACERAHRDIEEVKLVAVTKTATIEQIEEAVAAGCADLGENRVQHLKKVSDDVAHFLLENPKLPQSVTWHMIGHLQRNKVKQVLGLATLIHSVDTLRLAEEISMLSAKMSIKTKILLEINAAEEVQKYGIPIGAAIHLAEQIETLPNIELCGLMAMGPLTDDVDAIRLCFSRVHDLFVEMKGERAVGKSFRHISMGMSSDYEIAVEQGATILRIGSAIFNQ